MRYNKNRLMFTVAVRSTITLQSLNYRREWQLFPGIFITNITAASKLKTAICILGDSSCMVGSIYTIQIQPMRT